MFKFLVHENNADIERFHYLMSYLSGSVFTIVNMKPLTVDIILYSIMWNTL